MMTSAIYGHSLTPAALADEKGNVVMVQQCASLHWLERLLRPVSLHAPRHFVWDCPSQPACPHLAEPKMHLNAAQHAHAFAGQISPK